MNCIVTSLNWIFKLGFHRLRVAIEDIHKTTFKTHDGHYKFLVMQFGLMMALSTFQGLMCHLFIPYLRKCVLVFFDGILVYNRTMNEHVEHLRRAFKVLQENSLFAK